jgi:hypothetical protein
MIVAVQMLIAVPFCDHVGIITDQRRSFFSFRPYFRGQVNYACEPKTDGNLDRAPKRGLMVDMRQIITLYILYSTAVRVPSWGCVPVHVCFRFMADQLPALQESTKLPTAFTYADGQRSVPSA